MEVQLLRSAFSRQSVLPHIAAQRSWALVLTIGVACALGYALGLAAAIGLGAMISGAHAQSGRLPLAAEPAGLDPSRFILNALLVPALDPEALPLRWADPRLAMRCGHRSKVRVNGEPLRAGALVPDAPFELEWWADGCRPFGALGPQLYGGVKLTVFREDWGFSAMVEPTPGPAGLRAVSQGKQTLIQRGGATSPLCRDAVEPCLPKGSAL